MRSSTRYTVGLLLLGLTGFLLVGCGDASDKLERRIPSAFIFARGADAQKLDPADVDDGESVNTMAQMFEGLVGFVPGTLDVEPHLAASYEISNDGLQYTFKIREGEFT